MDSKVLQDSGLTKGESRVYLSLLEIGESTVGPIIDKSKVTKSSIYQILLNLMDKGLVSYIIKEKTRYYQAGQPERLLDYADELEKNIQNKKIELSKLLPQLKLLQSSSPESEVRTYIGFKGVVSVHEHTYEKLKKGEDYFYLGIVGQQPDYFWSYWAKDHRRRVKAGIKCKLLFNPDTDRKVLNDRIKTPGCDARYMPTKFPTPAWILGYKDVTAIGISGENAIVIEVVNQKIADAFREYFNEFWKRSEKYKR